MFVLVTGATGFIGGRLVKRLLEEGHRVRALVRETSDTRKLEALGVERVVGELALDVGLTEALSREGEAVEVVFHLAGVTKALDAEGFRVGNVLATENLLRAVAALPSPPRVVHCSSLAAMGPSTPGVPRDEADSPTPISVYGQSKLASERIVRTTAAKVPSVIVRPPLVYGPGDPDLMPSIAEMARFGLALKSGFAEKRYSMVHVDDLCEGLVLAGGKGPVVPGLDEADPTGVYFVSDDEAYRWEEVCEAFFEAAGRRRPVVVAIPDTVSVAMGFLSEQVARLRKKAPILNRDKVREMRAAAWACSNARARETLGFEPRFCLSTGMQDGVAWMRSEGLLGGAVAKTD